MSGWFGSGTGSGGGDGGKSKYPALATELENSQLEVQRQELELKMQARVQHNDNEAFFELYESHTNLKKVLWPGIVGAGVFGLVLGWGLATGRAKLTHSRLTSVIAKMDANAAAASERAARAERAAKDLATRKFATRTLQVADDFDRAERAAGAAGGAGMSDDAVRIVEGMRMTAGTFHKILNEFGVRRLDNDAICGGDFDPEWHEAVSTALVPAAGPDAVPANTVLEVLSDGYTIDSKLLRAARVIVAKPDES